MKKNDRYRPRLDAVPAVPWLAVKSVAAVDANALDYVKNCSRIEELKMIGKSMLSSDQPQVAANVVSSPAVRKAYVKPDIALLGSFSALTNTAVSGPRNDGQGRRP